MALAYTIGPFNPPADTRSAAHLKCVRCPEIGKVIISGIGNKPDKINKMFMRLQWDCDMWHPSRNWCPKCVVQRAEARKAEIEADAAKLDKAAARVLPTITGPAPPKNAPDHFSVGAGTRGPSATDQVTDIRKLPKAQKDSLKTALEAYFDPEKGQYEEGWSDKRVSDELQIPRRTVQEFRDIFYGEIKEDPEVAAFKQMYDEAKRVGQNLQSTLSKMEEKLDALLKKHGVTR